MSVYTKGTPVNIDFTFDISDLKLFSGKVKSVKPKYSIEVINGETSGIQPVFEENYTRPICHYKGEDEESKSRASE